MTIHKAAGIIITNRNLLVEKSKNKDFFIAPGGSMEEGETAKQTLVRELKEEFQIIVEEEDLEYFGTFTAPAAGQEQNNIIMEVFMVAQYKGIPTPDNEVETLAWINTDISTNIKVGSIFEHEVLPRLKEMDLVD